MQVGTKIQLINALVLLAMLVESSLPVSAGDNAVPIQRGLDRRKRALPGRWGNARYRAPARKVASNSKQTPANKHTVINNINVVLTKSQQQEALKQTPDDDLIDEIIRRRQQRLSELQEQQPPPPPQEMASPASQVQPDCTGPSCPFELQQPQHQQQQQQQFPAYQQPEQQERYYPNELVNNNSMNQPGEPYESYANSQAYAPEPTGSADYYPPPSQVSQVAPRLRPPLKQPQPVRRVAQPPPRRW